MAEFSQPACFWMALEDGHIVRILMSHQEILFVSRQADISWRLTVTGDNINQMDVAVQNKAIAGDGIVATIGHIDEPAITSDLNSSRSVKTAVVIWQGGNSLVSLKISTTLINQIMNR